MAMLSFVLESSGTMARKRRRSTTRAQRRAPGLPEDLQLAHKSPVLPYATQDPTSTAPPVFFHILFALSDSTQQHTKKGLSHPLATLVVAIKSDDHVTRLLLASSLATQAAAPLSRFAFTKKGALSIARSRSRNPASSSSSSWIHCFPLCRSLLLPRVTKERRRAAPSSSLFSRLCSPFSLSCPFE